jgi:hypothetical protein
MSRNCRHTLEAVQLRRLRFRSMFARVQRSDGTLEPARSVNVEDEPETGEYLEMDDGRRVQVMGYARETDGRLSYPIVAEAEES